ncbi:MAG TPA: hypothetical protein VFA18_09935 [Gemmataceae bacterium]|nr:hypothetical protein [Gemmataceae bacterium]
MATPVLVERYASGHLAALRRFACGITVITILGHAWLGFEQSYAQPLAALATAYSMQLLLETMDAWCNKRRPRFLGGPLKLLDFLLSAHITALAVAMLLYYNDQLWIVAFATAVAIGSKTIFRVPVGNGSRHFLNPSNFGIAVTLLLFPSVGIFIPWQFTEQLNAVGDWAFPVVILGTGLFLNARYNKRLPLITGFLAGFVLQALIRTWLFDTNFLAIAAAVTGPAAAIYVFFMVPDPATTPERPAPQVAFGLGVALVYLVLVVAHIVYGLFLALTIVCAVRGLWLFWLAIRQGETESDTPPARPAPVAAELPA